MSKLGNWLTSIFAVLLIAGVGIICYIFWPAAKGTIDGSKYYTYEEMQESYDKGYADGCKSEEELTGQVAYYKQIVDDYYIQVNNLNDEIALLTNSNTDYQTQITNLTNLKNQNESMIATLNETINANNNTINSLNLEIDGFEAQVENLNAEIATKESEINTLNGTIAGLNSEINTLNAQIGSLNSNIETDAAKIAELKSQIEVLKGQKLDLETQVTTLQNTLNSKNNEIITLNNSIKNLNNLVTNLQATNESQTQTITSLNTQIQNLNSQITDLTLQIQNNGNNVTILNKKIAELEKSVAYYEQYISSLENGSQVVLTFNYDNSVYNVQVIAKGATASVTTPTSTTYKIFNGWKVGDQIIDLATYVFNANTTITADVTYKYDVKFNVDGSDVNSQIVTKGATPTLPTNPTKAGYEFDGWSVNGVDIIAPEELAVTANVTYVAVFTQLHSVTFLYEDGTLKTETVRNGTYATAPSVANTDYKVFNGWKCNGSIVNVATYKITSATTFVADITYKYDVLFVSDSVTVNSQIITKGSTPILPTNPTKTGYEFDGWSIDGTNLIDPTTIAINANTTFIAVFTALPYTITLVNCYIENGMSKQDSYKVIIKKYNEELGYVDTPIMKKYRFDGWYATKPLFGDLTDPIDHIEEYIVVNNAKIYAKFTQVQVSLSVYDGDNLLLDGDYDIGSTLTFPTNITPRPNCEFIGYKRTTSGTDVYSSIKLTQSHDNAQYKAVFAPNYSGVWKNTDFEAEFCIGDSSHKGFVFYGNSSIISIGPNSVSYDAQDGEMYSLYLYGSFIIISLHDEDKNNIYCEVEKAGSSIFEYAFEFDNALQAWVLYETSAQYPEFNRSFVFTRITTIGGVFN